jgi:acetyltransferase-like isoleucine patch superfamily enzyme
MRRSIKRTIKAAGRKLLQVTDRFREPTVIGAENVFGLEHLSGIYPTTMLSAPRAKAGSSNHITLGRGVYLGRRVELEARGRGGIEIDEDTSLQDGCAVRGEVKIGAHCLFGHNGLVISSSHRFRDKPEWLIRDQDRNYQLQSLCESGGSIQIDDDCWLGWGCTVMPGVHIGRGAILGANSVITRNVAPYEIHGGAPNRKIGERLSFTPPRSISALKDSDLPYFYRGFRHLRKVLEQSRVEGIIFGRASAALVLAGLPSAGVVLKGHRFDSQDEFRLRFWLNGVDLGYRIIPTGAFDLAFSLNRTLDVSTRPIPAGLESHIILEWQDESRNCNSESFAEASSRYGISSAGVVTGDTQ